MASKAWLEEHKDDLRRYRRDWYARNKEKAKKRVMDRRRELRKWFTEINSKLKCSKCPEDHPGCLTFHHRDPDRKEYTLSEMVHAGLSRERILVEMKKCRVLCSNCHAKLHWGQG